MTDKNEIAKWFEGLQDRICKGLELADGKATFTEDKWQREGGGGGRTRVIQNGNVIEKGGVNFSAVFGNAPDFLSKETYPEDDTAKAFFATGVSIVIHPINPMVPIIHMNVRYLKLEASGSEPEITEWFGGGIDLTPIYVVEEDAMYFHTELKKICDKFSPSYYPDFKKWADDYFFIKHRKETRGIGGIFFDRLIPLSSLQNERRGSRETSGVTPLVFEFVKAIGESFLPIYSHIIQKNKDKKFTEKEKQWQLLRRGRYTEFNLVYDRGTKFGLETDGRAESILMSLPPQANWAYNFIPEKNSQEEKTLSLLKKGIEWVK